MAHWLSSPPPATASSFLTQPNSFHARTVLKESLFGPSAARVPYTVVGLCATLQVVLEAELADSEAEAEAHVWEWDNGRVNGILGQLDGLVARVAPNRTVNEYLVDEGLDAMFPLVADRLGLPLPHDGDGVLAEYLAQMALLHQLLTLAEQLDGDLALPNHKYYAHQIALLYSLFVQAGLKGSRFKKKVEAIFDAVKHVTESQDVPHLDDNLQATIREIAADVRATVSTFSSRLSGGRKLVPLRTFVAAHPLP